MTRKGAGSQNPGVRGTGARQRGDVWPEHAVGRRTQRAADVANTHDVIAPVLSRSVDVTSPMGRLSSQIRNAVRWRIQGAAQIQRDHVTGKNHPRRAETRPHRFAKRCGRGPRPTDFRRLAHSPLRRFDRFYPPGGLYLTVFFDA